MELGLPRPQIFIRLIKPDWSLPITFEEEGIRQPLKTNQNLFRQPSFYAAGLLFFGIGCLLPILELSIPRRFTDARNQLMLSSFFEDPAVAPEIRQEFRDFLSNGGISLTGRGLYPQFFPSGYGMSDDPDGPRRPNLSPAWLLISLVRRTAISHFPSPKNLIISPMAPMSWFFYAL